MTPSTAPADKPAGDRQGKAIGFLFAAVLIDVAGIGIIIPVMPALITQLTGQGLSAAAAYGGWLVAIFALMQFFASPLIGGASDRFGRRPVLLATMFLYGLSYLLMGLAHTLAGLFLARCISGVTSATSSTANAYLADVTAPEERSKRFGLMSASFSAGFIIGPALGGVLGEFGPRVPFHVAAVLAFFNVAYGYAFLPESLPPERRRPFVWRRANPLGNLLYLRRFTSVLSLISAQTLMMMANAALAVVWPYYAIESFGWSETRVGLSIAMFGLFNVLSQSVLLRIAVRRAGDLATLRFATVMLVCAYLFFALAPSGYLALLGIVCWSLGAMSGPVLNSLMSQRVLGDSQGALQGAIASTQSLVGVVLPPVMTGLFSLATRPGAPWHFPGAPYLASAAIAVCGALLIRRVLLPAAGTTSA